MDEEDGCISVTDIFYGTVRWPDDDQSMPLFRTLRTVSVDLGVGRKPEHRLRSDEELEELDEQLRLFDFFFLPIPSQSATESQEKV